MKHVILIASVLFTLTAGAQTAYEAQAEALAQRMAVYAERGALYSESEQVLRNIDERQLHREVDPHFIGRDRVVLAWWNTMLAEGRTQSCTRVAMPDISALRMIGQIVTPRTETDQENQEAELAWFRTQGFNGALLVWKGEPPETLARIAKQLKADGWILAWTYGPEETVKTRNYVDQDKYRAAVKLILPYCTFAIPTFRKATIIHFSTPENANRYRGVLTGLIREVAPSIPILGETTLRDRGGYTLINSTHAGTSGNIVFEAAYKDYRIEKVLKWLQKQAQAEPYLFLVIGPKPYYDTDYQSVISRGKALNYNLKTVAVINQNKQAALMLAGGGGGTRQLWGTEVSDDLTKTTWRK